MEVQYRAGQSIPGTPYRFVRMLGQGGHGVVYAVEHTFLQAPAVIKLLHADLVARGELAERMTREARTLAKLRHPNIVEVRDGGLTKETPPRPFFVMEALVGMSLRGLLRHVPGGLGVMPALRIIGGVLDGLQHAHRAGVVHRDVKPDNIFLHRTSTDLTVPKILDFGIAHLVLGQQLTGRHFIGTPRYSSPEQLRGDPPSPQTDIYATGLVLHEMLTAQAPFAHLKEMVAILHAHATEPMPLVSSIVANVPKELDALVASMLAKDPADRPPTALAAAMAIREIRTKLEEAQAKAIESTEFKTEATPMERVLAESGPDELALLTSMALPSGSHETMRVDPGFMTLPYSPEAMGSPGEHASSAPPSIDRDAATNTSGKVTPRVRVATNDTLATDSGGEAFDDTRLAAESASHAIAEHTTDPPAMARTSDEDRESAPVAGVPRRPRRALPLVLGAAALTIVGGGIFAFRNSAAPNRTSTSPPTAPSEAPSVAAAIAPVVTASVAPSVPASPTASAGPVAPAAPVAPAVPAASAATASAERRALAPQPVAPKARAPERPARAAAPPPPPKAKPQGPIEPSAVPYD